MQRVVIFGDIGKVFLLFLISILLHIDNNLVFSFASLESSSDKFLQVEADGSSEFNNFQPGSLNTTYQIIRDLENIDMVVHIGDICYANGYLSQWDQFTAQVEPIFFLERTGELSN